MLTEKVKIDKNSNFCALGSYVLLHHDFVEVKYLPDTEKPFTMKEYKEGRGMPYSKILFLLCQMTDYINGVSSPLAMMTMTYHHILIVATT